LLLGGHFCGFGFLGFLILLGEAVDAAFRVHQLLLAGEERMAGGADFHAHVALVGGARLEGVSARADDVDFVVSGVNTGLHFVTGIPFEISSIPKKHKPP